MFFKKKETLPIKNPSHAASDGSRSTPNGARLGLSKTRTSVLEKLSNLFKKKAEGQSLWDELEQILIEADMGVSLVCEVLENLKRDTKKRLTKTRY